MEIYIESFVIQNILINLCLLRLIYLTTKSQTSLMKLLISSIIGTVPSSICILFLTNNALINLLKIFTATIMLLIAFKQSKKQFAFNFILLFIYTYSFGGLITSISSSTYHTSFGAITTSKFSLELICLIILIFTNIFEKVVKHLKFKINTNSLIYNLTLTQSNKTIKINAYLDTGNFLNLNGNPILILDLNAYLKLTNNNLISFFTSNLQEIETHTVNGNKSLKICCIDKIKIENGKTSIELHNQQVAINTTNCFKNTNYQALISPLFL